MHSQNFAQKNSITFFSRSFRFKTLCRKFHIACKTELIKTLAVRIFVVGRNMKNGIK